MPTDLVPPEPESDHWPTCTHRMDACILVKDAEQVAVFWDAQRNIYHYSVRVQDWFSCSTVAATQYETFVDDPHQELVFIQGQARFLESLHR